MDQEKHCSVSHWGLQEVNADDNTPMPLIMLSPVEYAQLEKANYSLGYQAGLTAHLRGMLEAQRAEMQRVRAR